eukprot:11955940-Prorocentrum_lima.AAC.1
MAACALNMPICLRLRGVTLVLPDALGGRHHDVAGAVMFPHTLGRRLAARVLLEALPSSRNEGPR